MENNNEISNNSVANEEIKNDVVLDKKNKTTEKKNIFVRLWQYFATYEKIWLFVLW